MEKEYLGEVKSWEEIEKKAKELLEEGKIDAIEFISEERWRLNSEEIHSLTVLRELDELNKKLKEIKSYYLKKYDLYTARVHPMCATYDVLIIVCYT